MKMEDNRKTIRLTDFQGKVIGRATNVLGKSEATIIRDAIENYIETNSSLKKIAASFVEEGLKTLEKKEAKKEIHQKEKNNDEIDYW